MTALSGAHSIGLSQCSNFLSRLYRFNSSHPQDPTLDSKFANFLKKKCPENAINSADLDAVTPYHNPEVWIKDFAEAMVHLRNLDVLTGTKGEIRNKCGAVN
ncbi:hypothetical protein POM88_013836 [Heracleum sosnowskyi]|uniref:peroxidase n=1 Tax=Heracleum sosnowskyi TaxID=360622 RepID=A0AAD8J2Z2_9APIA|nr:hypothetical protein POM88_013836 [Heracleum sosnowskyi]